MDKRMIENARVKRSIEEALFDLLKEKNFSDITVSDLIRKAGVARTSYYRNFNSKEDIIIEYINRIGKDVSMAHDYSSRRYGERLDVNALSDHIACYLKEKHNIMLLYDNGFGTLMLDETNRFVEEALGDMPSNSIKRYYLYMISGIMFNVMMQWLRDGAKESPREMAEFIVDMYKKVGIHISDEIRTEGAEVEV